MSAAGEPVLAVADASVRFGGVRALGGVSFAVARGELVGLVGPNGAGKTTLLRAITGLVALDDGSVRLDGRDLRRLGCAARVRLGLGLSHQIVRPFRNLSVIENVMLAAGHALTASPLRAMLALRRGAARDAAAALLARVGIDSVADAAPSTQPLGVLKRLEVARALALGPRVLLLDEPLAGLGPVEAARLAETIAALNREGTTIVLIEHNLAEAQRICGRFVVLDNGRQIADGPPAAVLADPAVIEAYLGEAWRDAGAH